MRNVFLACPTYNGQMDAGMARAFYAAASQDRIVYTMTNGRSLLAANCNTLLCEAYNHRRTDPTIGWFAMLHSDIEPDMWWLDTLIDEAERVGADMISALVPIKDLRGITSTALLSDRPYVAAGRITQSQAWHESFPATFDLADCCDALARLPGDLRVEAPRRALLLNTGCMVLRLNQWPESVAFSMLDGIRISEDGTRSMFDFSEDWMLSLRLAEAGGRCFATRKIRCIHKGIGLFDSSKVWGIPSDFQERKK